MKIDASVIQRLSQGDREAYTAVFREYYAPLVVYSSRIVKEREIAEDIVQEFFCYLWKQRRQLAGKHSFTILFITVNTQSSVELLARPAPGFR